MIREGNHSGISLKKRRALLKCFSDRKTKEQVAHLSDIMQHGTSEAHESENQGSLISKAMDSVNTMKLNGNQLTEAENGSNGVVGYNEAGEGILRETKTAESSHYYSDSSMNIRSNEGTPAESGRHSAIQKQQSSKSIGSKSLTSSASIKFWHMQDGKKTFERFWEQLMDLNSSKAGVLADLKSHCAAKRNELSTLESQLRSVRNNGREGIDLEGRLLKKIDALENIVENLYSAEMTSKVYSQIANRLKNDVERQRYENSTAEAKRAQLTEAVISKTTEAKQSLANARAAQIKVEQLKGRLNDRKAQLQKLLKTQRQDAKKRKIVGFGEMKSESKLHKLFDAADDKSRETPNDLKNAANSSARTTPSQTQKSLQSTNTSNRADELKDALSSPNLSMEDLNLTIEKYKNEKEKTAILQAQIEDLRKVEEQKSQTYEIAASELQALKMAAEHQTTEEIDALDASLDKALRRYRSEYDAYRDLQTIMSRAEFGLVNLNQRLKAVTTHPTDITGSLTQGSTSIGLNPERALVSSTALGNDIQQAEKEGVGLAQVAGSGGADWNDLMHGVGLVELTNVIDSRLIQVYETIDKGRSVSDYDDTIPHNDTDHGEATGTDISSIELNTQMSTMNGPSELTIRTQQDLGSLSIGADGPANRSMLSNVTSNNASVPMNKWNDRTASTQMDDSTGLTPPMTPGTLSNVVRFGLDDIDEDLVNGIDILNKARRSTGAHVQNTSLGLSRGSMNYGRRDSVSNRLPNIVSKRESLSVPKQNQRKSIKNTSGAGRFQSSVQPEARRSQIGNLGTNTNPTNPDKKLRNRRSMAGNSVFEKS